MQTYIIGEVQITTLRYNESSDNLLNYVSVQPTS
jgi:hypothetical protein